MKPVNKKSDADLLYGLASIGSFIGLSTRQAETIVNRGDIPTFKLGRIVCARRSELDAHFSQASVSRSAPFIPTSELSPTTAILYGHRAIAAHLRMPVPDIARLDLERRIPTYLDDGCTVASTVALDHWNSMKGGR